MRWIFMIKKIIIGLLVVAVIALAGWRLFFSGSSTSEAFKDVDKNLTSYHMEATMDIENGEETRNYFVTTDYLKGEEVDNYRVSLYDKNINQEQILLRNDKGVFVLTPTLNQVYHFKGDWPLNTPKPYLYQSMLESLKGEHEIKKMDDGYILSYKPNYANAPTWVKEDIKFSKDIKPLWINIYNAENEAIVKIIFSKVEFDTTYDANFFEVSNNMEKARDGMEQSSSATINDLPLYPAGADVSAVLKEETSVVINGEGAYILVYEGVNSFTIVQSIVEPTIEMVVHEIAGELVELNIGFGYVIDNYLTYHYNGVRYQIYSNNMTVAQMIEVANGMEVVAMK